jgi:hypothetical protein
MSVSVEQFNALADRVQRLEGRWDVGFVPAQGPIAPPHVAEPPQAVEPTPAGAVSLRVLPMRSTERALSNNVFYNTGNPEFTGTRYLAHSRNMYMLLAEYDPTLPPGTLECNVLNRLNASLPLGEVCHFYKMGGTEDSTPCKVVHVQLTKVHETDATTGPSVDDIRLALEGHFIEHTRTQKQAFVICKENVAYKATICFSEPGLFTSATEVLIIA